ncbi:MAG: AAA family ATPase [Candidatus Falkowbacteria bacterium]|nr:AAA family ATPase [Candidatus Falkowbacteria bacterium]
MNLSKQKLIIIDGPMGAGKTTTANLLHLKLTDSTVNGICRIKHCVSGFSDNEKEYRIATDVILAMCQCYLNYGKSIIIEQCFRKKEIMAPYLNLAKDNRLPIFVYELHAPRKILLARAKRRPKESIKKNQVSYHKIVRNINSYPRPPYAPVRLYLDSSQLSPRQIINRIMKDLEAV